MKFELELPSTLHELIRLAVEDLVKVENNAAYAVRMGSWHEPYLPEYDGATPLCGVCFAGAVMAMHGPFALDDTVGPWMFVDDTKNKLHALDEARNTNFDTVLGTFYGEYLMAFNDFSHVKMRVSYADDPAGFKMRMLAIADKLAEAGL